MQESLARLYSETERADRMIEVMTTQLEAEGALYPEDEAGNLIRPIW